MADLGPTFPAFLLFPRKLPAEIKFPISNQLDLRFIHKSKGHHLSLLGGGGEKMCINLSARYGGAQRVIIATLRAWIGSKLNPNGV